MKHIVKLVFVALLAFFGATGQAQNTTTIPLDPEIKYGKLSNGMTYYIMPNKEPKERVSFFFVQNVGAILEEEPQNGLAHFLEHMAFNGLENFPGKHMLNYLQKNGMDFGREINAYTAQDETVYRISNVPVEREELIDSVLLVLHDWSGGLLLEAEEIEAERGVIHEEWRTRRNSRFRLMKQSMPLIYNYSKYAERDVIGSLDVIDNFEHKELREYYKKWYRPDLQAVVVVGDIDTEKLEKKVKKLFSKIPAKKNPAKREYYPIEDSKELGYVLATDKEAQSVSISWIFRKDPDVVRDEKYLRRTIAQSMLNSMINERLNELVQNPECPAVEMGVGNFEMARTKSASYLSVSPKEGKEKEAFRTLMTELVRVQKFGFNESELERAKTNTLRSYESYYESRDKISNDDWAKELGNHFLKAAPVPSVEWEVEFAKKTIPTITLKELYALLASYQNVNNSLFSLSGPNHDEINYPTKEELMRIVMETMSSDISAYEDNTDDSPLVSAKLKEKKVTSETTLKGTGAKIYELENGARIVIKQTDYNKDEVLFSAYSFGGSSLLERSDLESAAMAATLAGVSGIGEFDAIQLRKKMTGKIASVKAGIGTSSEVLSGKASPKDFETMLQLIYLHFENPRFDEDAFNSYLGMIKSQMINMAKDNEKALSDTLGQMMANHHERHVLFTEEFVKNISFEKSKRIYLDRIKDASDFTFIFVGNIEEKASLPLIQKYIGNITSVNREENFVDHNIRPAHGAVKNVFEREMEVSKTTVNYNLHSAIEYNLNTRVYVRIIADLLGKRYLETIREKEGGSYGVGVRPSIRKYPYEHYTLSIKFDCDPEKQEQLHQIVKDEIDKMVSKGVDAADLEEIKKNYIKGRAESELQNTFWLAVIEGALRNQEDYTPKDKYIELINSVNVKSVQKFAKEMFKNPDSVEVIMNPK